MAFQKSDLFSFYSHLIAAIASLIGYVALLCITWMNIPYMIVSSVYGLSMIFLFVSSSVYHGLKKGEDAVNFQRKLDHVAIFFLIAGTYTPICYIYFDGWWCWGIIGAQWLLVLAGLFLKLFWLKAPRSFNATIYILMGWMALIPIKQIIDLVPAHLIYLLVAGGLAYTIGAVFYMLKKPNPFPGIFGFHEIFHLLIIVGAVLHYILIFQSLLT